MITFDSLYEKFIKEVLEATSVEDIDVNSKAMRRTGESAAIHLLKLDIFQKRAWKKYYQIESNKVRTGRSRKDQGTLDTKASAVTGSEKITFGLAKQLKTDILHELGQTPGEFHIGHMEHGPAMDKARLIYDRAHVVDNVGDTIPQGEGKEPLAGITREQKELIRKIIYVQQAIERSKHSEIKAIKTKLGLKETAPANDTVLIEYLKSINEKITLNADFVQQTKMHGPELEYLVEFEAEASNADSGDLTKLLGIKLSNIVRLADNKALEKFMKKDFAQALINIPGSDTFIQRTDKFVRGAIKRKRLDAAKSKKSRKHTVESKASNRLNNFVKNVKKERRQAAAVIRRTKIEEPKVELVGLFNIMGLINTILAKEIETQMGKSNDPPVRLRYQTGRFAHSAKLLVLAQSKGQPTVKGALSPPLIGVYTYMHYPYDVFLPGHRLDNGRRDPRVYIEHGIRAAARTMLEGRFPGMVLEAE